MGRMPCLTLGLVVALAFAMQASAVEPPEYRVLRSSWESMYVPGTAGTVGATLGAALSDWQYTLPLEFVRKGQAYVGASTRLRRVMADWVAGARQRTG